jgi:hypothetical protein
VTRFPTVYREDIEDIHAGLRANERQPLRRRAVGVELAIRVDGRRVVTGSKDNTARLWNAFPSVQALVEEVKASVPRCLTPEDRERFHLGRVAPLWCHARNLWPYADHGPPESQAASPPYGPPAMTWEERLITLWDRSTGWLAGPDTRITPTARGGTK